jgi:predicted transcriptional regulator
MSSQPYPTQAPITSSATRTKVRDVMKRGVTLMYETDSAALAHQLMLWNGIRHIPVLRHADDKLLGVVSERDVLRALRAGERAEGLHVRDIMSAPADHVHPNENVADAAADLVTKQIGCLPVVDAGEVVGIVTAADVLQVLAQYPAKRRVAENDAQSVASIMYPEPIAVHEDDRLVQVAQRLAQRGVRHACVVDGTGVLIGIMSDRDVRRLLGDPRRTLDADGMPKGAKELRVSAAMTPNPIALGQDDTIRSALELLVKYRFGALPVVDDDRRLRGIVSYLDVLQHFADDA